MRSKSTTWEFLQPFYSELSSRWGLHLVPVRASTTLHAYLRGFEYAEINAGPERVAAVRDAMELLLLQSLVDRRAFLKTVLSCGRIIQFRTALVFVDDPDASVPCYLRLWCPEDTPASLTTFLSTFFTPTERNSSFLNTRARIIGLIDSLHKLEDADRIRRACAQLKISVEVVFRRSAISSRLLRLLTQFQQQTKQSAENDSDRTGGVYQLDNLSVRVKGDKITLEAMELLQSIVAHEDLELKNRELLYLMGPRQPRPSTVKLAKALTALISTTDPKQPDTTVESDQPIFYDEGAPQIRSFTAKIYRYDTGFRQICSSLMVARDIEAVTLDLLGTNNNRAFQNRYLVWLFHALFSSSSSHAIRHVSLPIVSVSTEQMEQMQRYSQCSNPAAFLHDPNIWGAIDLERECMRPRRRVIVAKGTPLTCRQSSTLPHEVVGHLQAATSCDVLYDGGKKGVHVLVPGYGHCRVPPSSVEWEEAVQPWPSLGHHAVKSLTINRGEWQLRHDTGNTLRFCSLLALIGGQLEEFHIKVFTHDTTILIDHVLNACPRLKAIRLFGSSSEWVYASIVDAYRTGACKATTLDLMGLNASDSSADIARFFYALGNQRSAIGATVEQLSMSLRPPFEQRHESIQQADGFFAEQVQAVEKMLASNRKLRVFSLNVPTAEAFPMFAPLQHRFHDQYFSTDPVPIKAKLAFLSALRRDASVLPVEDAMARLDSYLITVIFQLAATPIKRIVKIRNDGRF